MPRRLKNQISRSYCREKSNWSWWNRIIIIALVTVVHQFQCRILTRRPLSLKLRHRLRFSYQRRVAANSICYNREHEEPHRTFDDSVLTDGVAHHRCHLRLILDSYCISCKFRQWSNRFLNQQSWSFILILYLYYFFFYTQCDVQQSSAVPVQSSRSIVAWIRGNWELRGTSVACWETRRGETPRLDTRRGRTIAIVQIQCWDTSRRSDQLCRLYVRLRSTTVITRVTLLAWVSR